ncbi:MAG: PQQ-binding-like beta-propeller repeat protein [Thermoleophilia bacterium]
MRGRWGAGAAVAAMIAASLGGAAAAAAPAAVPGWPVAARAGQVLPGPGNGAVIIAPDLLRSSGWFAIAFRSNATRLWRNRGSAGCGNCDDGPQPTRLQPDGTYGPLGPDGDRIWAVDRRGRAVSGCSGVVRADGTCIFVGGESDHPDLPVVIARRQGRDLWRLALGDLRWQDEFNVPPMVVADRSGRVYVALRDARDAATGTPLPGVVIAVDTAAPGVAWTRLGPSRMLAGLDSGALATDGSAVASLDADGALRWSRAIAAGQAVTPATVAVDPVRQRLYLGRIAAAGRPAAGVTAVDAATGAQLWRTADGDRAALLSTGPSGRVYVALTAPARRAVRAIAADGRPAWTLRSRLPVTGAAELRTGLVAVSAGSQPGADGTLTLLDPRRRR